MAKAQRKPRAKALPKTKTGCRPDQLFGDWMIEPQRFDRMLASVREHGIPEIEVKLPSQDDKQERFERHGGLAIIELSGPLTKYPHSLQSIVGGTSMIEAQRAVREAADDDTIDGVLLLIDSPGGTAAGTADLAQEVAAAKAKKPVWAYASDLCASAAYWIGSQADRLYGNQTATVGSIGVLMRLEDSSKQYELAGVKVHRLATGEFKGAGMDGAEVTERQLKYLQSHLDDLNRPFMAAVAEGRGLELSAVEKLADGRVHVPPDAVELGLLDGVRTLDETISAFEQELKIMADPVAAFAEQHPDAVSKWQAEGEASGLKKGKTEGGKVERDRFAALQVAFPGRADFVAEMFAAGSDTVTAQAQYAKVLVEENASQAEANAKQAARIAELEQQAAAGSEGHPGVSHRESGGEGSEKTDLPPDELAAKHWKENHEDCRKAFSDVESYQAFLENESRIRVHGTAD